MDALSPAKLLPMLQEVYKEYVTSFSTVNKWSVEFKCGQTFLEDHPREGQPKMATSNENIENIQNIGL